MFQRPPTRPSVDAALRDLAHPDPRVKCAAADALGTAPPDRAEEAGRALREALDDGRPDVRYTAALSLGELRDAEAVDRLIFMLEDQDIMARQAAVISLGKIGDGRAVEPLIRALAEGPPDVRFQAVGSLSELDEVRAVAPLCRALEDNDVEVRASAAAALGDLEAHEAADALSLLLADPRETVRFEAAYALGRLGDERAVEIMCRLTTHREFGFLACERLGRLGDRRAVGPLRRAWKRLFSHPLNRVRAAGSLIQLGEEEPRAYLLKAARSLRSDVRGLALEILGQVGGEWGLETLLRALKGPSADAAARALGRLGNREAVGRLEEALARAGDDEELRADLEEALDRLR